MQLLYSQCCAVLYIQKYLFCGVTHGVNALYICWNGYIYTFMDKQNVFLENNTLLPIKTTGHQYRYNMLLYQSERLKEYAVHSMLTDNGEVFKL